MKATRSSRAAVGGKRSKAAKANGAAPSRQRLSKSKVKYSARELAGSLHRYAKGRPDPARVREFVRQKVSRAAALEG